MPPPMMSRRSGTSFKASAPVESMMRSSSGRNGSLMLREPAAMMHCLKGMVWVAPSSPVTVTLWVLANLATPRTTLTLRPFAMPARPPVSFLTTLSLCWRRLSTLIFGASNWMPELAMLCASSMTSQTCSSALDGMQPTLRQTPPRVW